ncbi:MAG: glycosyltransferase [Muribaculaceae bacterium]|nr:glycosyltransferase [Muribaculaceae bacterium]
MKVVHVISSLEIGGAQKLLSDFLPILKRDFGLDITVIVFQRQNSSLEDKIMRAGIPIISLDTSIRSPKVIAKLIPHLKKADLAHIHLFPANYFAALAKTITKTPLIFTEHSTHNRRRAHKWLQPLERWVYSQYEAVGCISESTQKNLSEWIGEKIIKSRGIVVENGIDLEPFQNRTSKNALELFGREGFPVLMVSRFVPSKDQATVIRAISRIPDKRVFAVFAGDGETIESNKNLSKQLGVSDRTVFLGERGDIPDLIHNSFIGVQSSNWEGFGLTAVEMMAGNLPVIASEVAGLKEVVTGTGLLFPAGDDEKLTNLIMNLIEKEEIRQELISKGKRKAVEFSIFNTAEKYHNLYKKVLNSSY